MKRIIIFGPSNAGKSTFARALGEKLDIPVHHLDAHFWKAGWERATRDEMDPIYAKLVAGEQWIIEGGYDRPLAEKIERADTAIILAAPMLTRVLRWMGRIRKYRKGGRPDMAEGNPERFDWVHFRAMLKQSGPQRKLTAIGDLRPDMEIVVLRTSAEAKAFLAQL